MSRVEAFPTTSSPAPSARSTLRSGSDDGAGFEVAIRSQLDAGRADRSRERSEPSTASERARERSQRPPRDRAVMRPGSPIHEDRQVRSDRDRPVRAELAGGSQHEVHVARPGGDGHAAPTPDAAASQPSSDAAAATSLEAGTGTSTVGAPVVDSALAAGGLEQAAAAMTTGGPTGGPTMRTSSDETVVAATQAATTAAPTRPAGATAADAAAPTAEAPAADATGPGATPATHSAAGQPTDGHAGAHGGGQPGQPGSGQTGSGPADGSPVPTLVHGRPAALAGPTGTTGDGTTGSSTGPTVAAADGALVTLEAHAVPLTTSTSTSAVPQQAAVGLPTAAVDAAAATAAAPPSTGATVATPGATAPAANPVVPLSTQAQVLGAVSPLLTGPDGTHRVTVHLEPENLGKVRVQVSLSGGEVALHLIAADAVTRETLRLGLPELRAQLEQSGLRTADMDVRSGPSDLFGRDTGAGTDASGGRAARPVPGAAPQHRTTTGGTALPDLNPASRSLSHDVALDVRM
ncbi:flagellar hook-length control protein FliK [Pedococcus sp. KACC 23699]|uniref:Flagellar hook-length control protein FliK n=1 Tax=Pedococcus sp. KACC 23699 TaxID=3149228 RepID=A0AAU7JZI1_9MICO